MSAWAVFSMIGLYPDVPGVPEYTLTVPTFDKITIKLNSDYYHTKSLIIEKSGNAKKCNVLLDGTPIGHRISHQKLVNGKKLLFTIDSRKK